MGNTHARTMATYLQGQDWAELGWSKPKIHNTTGTGAVAKAAHAPSKANRASALMDATEAGKIPTVSLGVRQRIQQARTAKGLTQAKLAAAINVPVKLINEYESGKAMPEPAVMAKLSRALGTSLKEKKSNQKGGTKKVKGKKGAAAA